jgi:hypothetical protein
MRQWQAVQAVLPQFGIFSMEWSEPITSDKRASHLTVIG